MVKCEVIYENRFHLYLFEKIDKMVMIKHSDSTKQIDIFKISIICYTR